MNIYFLDEPHFFIQVVKLTDKLPQIIDHEPHALIHMVDEIRPSGKRKIREATKNLEHFINQLRKDPQKAARLKRYFSLLIRSKQCIQLFTNSGIYSNKNFFRETKERIVSKFIPWVYNENDHTGTFNDVFHESWDYKWVEAIPDEQWSMLFQQIGLKQICALEKENSILPQLLNSILVVSQRVAALGLEPEILEKLPELEEFDSPFMVQNVELFRYVSHFMDEGFDRTDENQDYKQILVMLVQCEEYIDLIKRNKNKFGTDLHLTSLLKRILQNIGRLRRLLHLACVSKNAFPFEKEISFFKMLVRAENKKNSLREHFDNNLNLLAFQVTEHAGRTGEHYITNTTKEYGKMLVSAMGGGLIVGFLSLFKVLISYLHMSPFGQAFLYSMNYSLGFIGIHLSHSTLATKQPAMTASKLAASLDLKTAPDRESIHNLADLIVKISRSQFIAFVGNVMIAFPVAFGLAMLYHAVFGTHVAGTDKAIHLIEELDPLHSYAIFHAGIAGFFLFLSGLLSGYYDNKNVYYKIPARLRKHRFLNKILGIKRTERLSRYIDNNLGNLAGNFFLGIFLGSTGTIGYILGLPLDIRHITFASANFGLAVASIGESLSHYQIGISIAGIFAIGIMNFLVSFSLAILVAIKSRNVNFRQTRKLFSYLAGLVIKHPLNFFFPPRYYKHPEESEEDGPKPDKDDAVHEDGKVKERSSSKKFVNKSQ